jgi:hypothetical protein
MPCRHSLATRSAIYTGCLSRYLPRLFNTNIYLLRSYANKHPNHLHRHHQSTPHTALLSTFIIMSEDDDTILRRTTRHRGFRRPTAQPSQENEQMAVNANNGPFARPNISLASSQRPPTPSPSQLRSPLLLRRNVIAPFNRRVPLPNTPIRAGTARRMSPEEKSLASRFIIQENARRAQEDSTDEPNPLPDQQTIDDSPTSPSPSPSPSQTKGASASLVQDEVTEEIGLNEVSGSQAGPSPSVSQDSADVATPSSDAAHLLDDDEGPRGYSAPCPTPPLQRERSHFIEILGTCMRLVRTGQLSMERVMQAINEGIRRGVEQQKRGVADPDVLDARLKQLVEKQKYQ